MSRQGPVGLGSAEVLVDTVLEVRTGKMQSFEGINVQTGIFKTPHESAMHVGEMGIEGDEHDYTFHGGVDKAVHAYCSAHYPSWRAEFPEAAALFAPGAFGENLVLGRMSERNVCIGDVVEVGPELRLQVSLPRQPCFKLNHRFRIKNFAPSTWRLSRTGWYYRVLRPGSVRAGDEVRLVERRHPAWTIERVQEYLHRDPGNGPMNEELASIPEFGEECAGAFRRRVAKQRARERRAQTAAEEALQWREFRIVEKRRQTPRVVSLVLEAVEPVEDPELAPGSHAKVRLGNGLVRNYSVVSGSLNRFELGVALADGSRGASRYLHETAAEGDVATVGRFTAGVPLAPSASNHVFVAGGIGVTAFLAMVEKMRDIHLSATLHYAVRSAADVPFRERADALAARDGALVLYAAEGGRRLDIGQIVAALPWNSQLYFCGPRRMMDEALRVTRAAGLGEREVHFEAFEADASGDPFEADVVVKAATATAAEKEEERQVTLQVGAEETLLEAMQKQFGVDAVPSSCEVGNCGTCRIRLRAGQVDHRGTAMTEAEKAGHMLPCVSRGVGRIVVEI
ncbi:hypothetical protein RB595_002463 [Gaeumannomyces hyphopodioides]